MTNAFWFLVGLVLAAAVVGVIRRFRPNQQLQAWSQALLIAALIYVGFALLWGDATWIAIEAFGVLVCGAFIIAARRYGAIWLAVGWLLHPLWDVALHLMGPGHDVAPAWYAIACLSFDFAAAAYVFYLAQTKQEAFVMA